MSNEDYINLAKQFIFNSQQKANIGLNNLNQNFGLNHGLNMEQSLMNAILEPLLNPSKLKTSGKHIIDSMGNDIALYERIEGYRINSQGITEEIDKEYHHVMSDGSIYNTDYYECLNCGEIVHSIYRCPVCSKHICELCGVLPKSKENNIFYCSSFHRILSEGLF